MENNNKLIAEFMEFQYTSIGWYDAEESLNLKGDNTFDELKFDTDWNWLMPVIRKIEELGNDVLITTNYIQISFDEGEQFIVIDDLNIKIDSVYKAVVEFINWYNNKQ